MGDPLATSFSFAFFRAADQVFSEIVSYTQGSGQIALKPGDGSKFAAPLAVTGQIVVTAITALTYGTTEEVWGNYSCTGVSGDTLTGLTLINGTDNPWKFGDNIEMRQVARLTNDTQDALNSLPGFAPFAVSSSTTLDPGDLLICNATNGSFTGTLPLAPPDGTIGGIYFAATSGINTVSLAIGGGSDTFAGGGTVITLSLVGQLLIVQYNRVGAQWAPFAVPAPLLAQGTNITLATNNGVQTISATGGTGTVTAVGVASANGFAGTSSGDPADPILTLSTTASGVLKGSSGALVAATPGTDYLTGNQAITLTGDTTGTGTTAITTSTTHIGGQAVTLGGALTTSGAFATTITTTGTTSVTLPTTGTLVNTAVTTLASLALSATQITTGTLPAARLPNPTASTLGGVESAAAVAHQWINSISTAGVPALSQPAFTDISGTVAASQLPAPTATTLGGIESFAAVSHQWINAISTSGVPSSTQPAFTDISGTATAAQLPLATTGAFGAVKPDGTTITISGGVITSTGGGGSPGGSSGQFQFDNSGSFGGSTNFNYDSTNTCPKWIAQTDPTTPAAGDRWLSTATNSPVDCRIVDSSAVPFLVREDGTFFSCGPCTGLSNFTTNASLLQSPTSPIGSLVIPANTLAIGQILEFWFAGVYSSSGSSASLDVLVSVNGSTVVNSTLGDVSIPAATTLPWGTFSGPVIVGLPAGGSGGSIFNGGKIVFTKSLGLGLELFMSNGPGSGTSGTPVAFNTTVENTLDLRCVCNTASTSNAIQVLFFQARIRG